MEPNRIKDILRKIESGEPNDFLPTVKPKAVPEPEKAPIINDQSPNHKFSKLRITILALLTFLVILVLGYASYSAYANYRAIRSGDPKAVVEALGKLTDLPADEAPTVSTITDLEAVKGQPFFKDAQEGDRVVVYNGIGRAYLYRPSTNKIILIAPLAQQ